jgi:ElaB/YqjD/DUF883 family membrane-anchored ribosome-binding protein
MSQDSSTTADSTQSKLDTGKEHVRRAAEDLKAAAQAKAQELRQTATAKAQELRSAATHHAEEFRHKAEQAWEDAGARARTFRDDSEKLVREKPMQSVITAFAVGFVIGLLIRR